MECGKHSGDSPVFPQRKVKLQPLSPDQTHMKLGFVGTGEITAAIVTGLSSAGAEAPGIRLSPRNLSNARTLAERYPNVSIACSNQDVLDFCEIVVIAVRPQIARSVLSDLRFRPEHHVISVVSALALRSLLDIVRPASKVTRAVPLPSAARRLCPTAIYPPDLPVENLFVKIGTVFPVERENEFNAICAVTATIASYYAFVEQIASWLAQQQVPEATARDYVARMFLGLTAGSVNEPGHSFQLLASAHATVGGINEQFLRYLSERGLFNNVPAGLDVVLERIRTTSEESSC